MSVRIRLLGRFSVEVDGGELPASWPQRRPADLVKLLALSPQRQRSRDAVIEALWPHLDAEAGAANLHKAASLARRTLADRRAVVLRGGLVSLWPGQLVDTDVAAFEAAANEALTSGDPTACRVAAESYGELLPDDRYEEWTLQERERLRLCCVGLLRAAREWERLLEIEPADEQAHRELMRAHADAGDRHAVGRQFRALRDALAREFGLGPSPETVTLFDELSGGRAVAAPLGELRLLVGRQVEMARLRALWKDAAAGQGGAVVVTGEAGIGKTRFCEELLAEANDAGWTTLRGAASSVEAALPYAVVVEALDRLLLARPDLAETLPDPAHRALAMVVAAGAGTSPLEPVHRQQVISAVARLVAAAAKERGVVVLADDVHAADEASLELLHYLARTAAFQPLMIVLCTRSGEASPAAQHLVHALTDQRHAALIELGPLTVDEVGDLVEGLGGDRPERGACEELWRRSGGNPYFLEELAAAEPAAGEAAFETVIGARLARIPDGLRDLLGQVAVLGEAFESREAAATTGLTWEEVDHLLDDALERRLVVIAGTGYRFRHEIMREVILKNVAPGRRRNLHRRAAEALERDGGPAARIAHHLIEAGMGAEAVPWLSRATADALATAAYSDAQRLADQALAVTPDDVDLLALRADAQFLTGDPSAPLAYAKALGRARGAEREVLRIRLARALVFAGDPEGARVALEGVQAPSPEADALRHLVEGQVAWMTGDLDGAERAVGVARSLAVRHGMVDVLIGVTTLSDLVAHNRGQWPEAILRDLDDPEHAALLAGLVYDVHLCGAEAYLYGTRPYEEVKGFARSLTEAAERSGAARGRAFGVTLLGTAELLAGELEDAERDLAHAADLHRELGSPGGEALALQRLAEVRLSSEREADARELLGRALVLARAAPGLDWHLVVRVYGAMVKAAEDPQAAVAVIEEAAVGLHGPVEACPPCSVTFFLPAAAACAQAGDPERARGFLEMAEPMVMGVWGGTGGWGAALAEARATLARAQHDEDTARTAWAEAAEGYARAGQPIDAERCREALAAL